MIGFFLSDYLKKKKNQKIAFNFAKPCNYDIIIGFNFFFNFFFIIFIILKIILAEYNNFSAFQIIKHFKNFKNSIYL